MHNTRKNLEPTDKVISMSNNVRNKDQLLHIISIICSSTDLHFLRHILERLIPDIRRKRQRRFLNVNTSLKASGISITNAIERFTDLDKLKMIMVVQFYV